LLFFMYSGDHRDVRSDVRRQRKWFIRDRAGDTPANGYATATVGGERHIGASHNKTIVGSGSSINISFRAISSNNGASVSGAGCWAMAIPRNVPAS